MVHIEGPNAAPAVAIAETAEAVLVDCHPSELPCLTRKSHLRVEAAALPQVAAVEFAVGFALYEIRKRRKGGKQQVSARKRERESGREPMKEGETEGATDECSRVSAALLGTKHTAEESD